MFLSNFCLDTAANIARQALFKLQTTVIVASFLRDVLATCAQMPDLVINVDVRSSIDDVAARTDEARVARALAAVRVCDEAISYNVSPETCIDALLLEVKEALYGSNSPR